MEQGTAFWLAATSQASELVSSVTTCADSDQLKKAGDLVSMFNQPAVVNFASVLTGGNGAFDPSRTIRILPTEREPALNENCILQKRPTQFSIGSLPSVSTAVISSSLLQPPTSTMVVNTLNTVAALPMCAYPLQLPSDTVQISKNFIQHAAVASGLSSTNSASLPTARVIQNSSLNGDSILTYVGAATDSIAPNSDSSPASLQPEVSSAYQCSDCNKTFENTGQLRYHTFVAHGELQARPHKCSACPESFLMDHHLNDHIRAIHLPSDQGGGPPFTCSECSTSFNDGGHLNFHLYMAHTIQGSKSKQLRYPCPECGKNFNKSSLLDEHIRISHAIEDSSEPDMKQTRISLVQGPNLHKCFDCGKAFKTYPYLKQHMMSVHDKPLKCTICNRGFGRKSDLKRHMRGVHLKKRPYVCTKCGWTFSEIGNLKHHLQAVHQREKNFKCTYCHKTFSLLSYLKTHLSRMHKSNSNNNRVLKAQDQIKQVQISVTTAAEVPQLPIVRLNSTSTVTTPINAITLQAFKSVVANSQMLHCYECGQVCDSSESLQNHVISTHPQPFWCTVCGEGFSDGTHLQVHLQLRHLAHGQHRVTTTSAQSVDVSPTDIGEFAIEIPRALAEGQAVVAVPSDVTKTVFSALQTVPSMHGVEQTVSLSGSANKCLMCGAILNENPEAHVCWKKINTSNIFGENELFLKEDRPHSCSVCGKGFKTTTHLKQHVRCVHSKQRPHKCPHCDKCFARMSDKNRHVKGVHQRIKNVKNSIFVTLKCSECGAMYAETSQLKKHIYTHHLRGNPSYKCADCQEGFSDDASFQNHICHEVDKPHVCSICAKRFHMVQQLRRHIRAAHGKHSEEFQTHKCFQCERVFGRPVDLERHIQAVHLKEKPHKCTLCGKSFGLQGNLNKHVRAVHLLEKPHQCVECGKKFAHIGVLKRHLRDIHFYDKKASVKEKLALLQVKNSRQLMCNVTNLQDCDLNEADQVDTQTQTTLNHVRQNRPEPSQHQPEQDSQHAMSDHHVDLPLIETISQQQLQEVTMQVQLQDHVGNV